jgi:hypothetical protein
LELCLNYVFKSQLQFRKIRLRINLTWLSAEPWGQKKNTITYMFPFFDMEVVKSHIFVLYNLFSLSHRWNGKKKMKKKDLPTNGNQPANLFFKNVSTWWEIYDTRYIIIQIVCCTCVTRSFLKILRGCCGRGRMVLVVGFTTTCAICLSQLKWVQIHSCQGILIWYSIMW